MNARIVNLRRVRKRKARAAARQAGDQRALDHGRTRAERDATEAEAARIARLHEGHRRDAPQAGADGDPDDRD